MNTEPRSAPPLGLGRLWLGSEEEALVQEVLHSRCLNRFAGPTPDCPPPMALALEGELAALFGSRHALAVTSGTAALETALGALEIGPGDEVIVPAWSWIACFTSIVRCGARPVLAEVDESLCLAPGEIPRLLTPRTKAAMVIHFQGVPAELDTLAAEARAAGIALIEDCAQSPGAIYKGRRVGTWGTIGTFSFQNQKTITSGEGGAVVTDDPALFERAVRMHDLGQYRPVFEKGLAPQGEMFCGGQCRMSELTAAVALGQLRKLDAIRAHCRNLRRVFDEALGDLPAGLSRQHIPDPSGDSSIEMYFFAESKELAASILAPLKGSGVNCVPMTGTYTHYRRAYCERGLTHSEAASPFRELGPMPAPGYRPEDFPRTESLVHRLIALPFGVAYTEQDAIHMAETLHRACSTRG
jgi:8-amino-3,8-dideoxy-alpha-D-manno-octulosonate transaminase